QVIVDPDTDFPEERFQAGAELFVERNDAVDRLRIASVRFHRDRPVIGFAEIGTIDEAEALAGREFPGPADRPAGRPGGGFYRHDLIGCAVETIVGERVGVVRGVEGTMGASRLVVEGPRGEVLVPLAAEICTSIDVAAKRITIAAPDGLL